MEEVCKWVELKCMENKGHAKYHPNKDNNDQLNSTQLIHVGPAREGSPLIYEHIEYNF